MISLIICDLTVTSCSALKSSGILYNSKLTAPKGYLFVLNELIFNSLFIWVFVCVCLCVFVCAWVSACVRVCMGACVYVLACLCACVCVYVCVYIFVCGGVYLWVYLHRTSFDDELNRFEVFLKISSVLSHSTDLPCHV